MDVKVPIGPTKHWQGKLEMSDADFSTSLTKMWNLADSKTWIMVESRMLLGGNRRFTTT